MENFISHLETGVGPMARVLLLQAVFKDSFALDQQPDFLKMASSSTTMLEICLEKYSAVFLEMLGSRGK